MKKDNLNRVRFRNDHGQVSVEIDATYTDALAKCLVEKGVACTISQDVVESDDFVKDRINVGDGLTLAQLVAAVADCLTRIMAAGM